MTDDDSDELRILVNTPKVREAARVIRRVHEFHGVGGNLHAELDDHNFDFFDHQEEMTVWDAETSEERLEVERHCFALMKAMNMEERESAIAMYRRWYWDKERTPIEGDEPR
ncbi:MAG: hypothetical protein AB7G11_02380 [Phycisphaerales bacterium]